MYKITFILALFFVVIGKGYTQGKIGITFGYDRAVLFGDVHDQRIDPRYEAGNGYLVGMTYKQAATKTYHYAIDLSFVEKIFTDKSIFTGFGGYYENNLCTHFKYIALSPRMEIDLGEKRLFNVGVGATAGALLGICKQGTEKGAIIGQPVQEIPVSDCRGAESLEIDAAAFAKAGMQIPIGNRLSTFLDVGYSIGFTFHKAMEFKVQTGILLDLHK